MVLSVWLLPSFCQTKLHSASLHMMSTDSFIPQGKNASSSRNYLTVKASSVCWCEAELLLLLQQPGGCSSTLDFQDTSHLSCLLLKDSSSLLSVFVSMVPVETCFELLQGGWAQMDKNSSNLILPAPCLQISVPFQAQGMADVGQTREPWLLPSMVSALLTKGSCCFREVRLLHVLWISSCMWQKSNQTLLSTWDGCRSQLPILWDGLLSQSLVLLLSLSYGFFMSSLCKRRGEAREPGVSDPSTISPGGQGAANWHLICLVVLVRILG